MTFRCVHAHGYKLKKWLFAPMILIITVYELYPFFKMIAFVECFFLIQPFTISKICDYNFIIFMVVLGIKLNFSRFLLGAEPFDNWPTDPVCMHAVKGDFYFMQFCFKRTTHYAVSLNRTFIKPVFIVFHIHYSFHTSVHIMRRRKKAHLQWQPYANMENLRWELMQMYWLSLKSNH